MAYIISVGGKKQNIPRDKALDIWARMVKPEDLTDDQIAYLNNIKALYLDWRTAPDDYIQEHFDAIIPMTIRTWRVNRAGKYTQPDTDYNRRFAIKWGLWAFGGPTNLARKHI